MSRKHPPADRDLRLTDLEGKPVTVNFNFVAIREPVAVRPHTYLTMHGMASRKSVSLEENLDESRWVLKKKWDTETSIGFARQSLPGTRLTVVTGSKCQLLDVIQTPEEIESALRRSRHDLHAGGLQKWVVFEANEKSRLNTAVRRLDR
jgi:hypothetical protein